mmetsp:Transcript_59854/g.120140  ORF Transcript_59854/g.120140 Transcript_59854/m.120140 type:complete len:211 (+) Transcript_59854:2593-3225(+)
MPHHGRRHHHLVQPVLFVLQQAENVAVPQAVPVDPHAAQAVQGGAQTVVVQHRQTRVDPFSGQKRVRGFKVQAHGREAERGGAVRAKHHVRRQVGQTVSSAFGQALLALLLPAYPPLWRLKLRRLAVAANLTNGSSSKVPNRSAQERRRWRRVSLHCLRERSGRNKKVPSFPLRVVQFVGRQPLKKVLLLSEQPMTSSSARSFFSFFRIP